MTILPPTIASLDQMLQTWKLAWRTVRLTDNKAVSLLVDSALSKRQGMSIKFASKSTFFFGRSWNCILNPIHHSASRIIIFMLSAYSNSQKVLWVFSFWALAFDSVISYSCRKSTQRRKRKSASVEGTPDSVFTSLMRSANPDTHLTWTCSCDGQTSRPYSCRVLFRRNHCFK